MTEKSPPPGHQAWHELLDIPPQPDGDESELSAALIEAMREASGTLTPSAATQAKVWRRIEQSIPLEKAAAPREMPWWRSFLSPRWGFAALAVAVFAGVAIWSLVPVEPDYDVVAMRGVPQRVVVADYGAETPAVIGELLAMGASVKLERQEHGILATVRLPDSIPTQWETWRKKWGIQATEGKTFVLMLVPSEGK